MVAFYANFHFSLGSGVVSATTKNHFGRLLVPRPPLNHQSTPATRRLTRVERMIEPAFASVEALGPDLPAVPAETQRNRRGGGWQRHLWTLHACGFALLIAGLAAV